MTLCQALFDGTALCFYQKIAFISEDFYSYLRQILCHVVMC